MRARLPASVLGVTLAALALTRAPSRAEDPAALPGRLAVRAGETVKVHVDLSLASTFRSKDHRLRSLDDTATLALALDLAAGEKQADGTPVTASFRSVEVRRRFRAKTAGFFVESDREGKGAAAWHQGEPDGPAAFRALLGPSGRLLAPVSPVTSEAARWPGEAWLDPRDHGSDDDARVRRLARYTALGTLLGAPALPPAGERRFEATFPLGVGESGLTNSFVELEATYALETEAREGGLVRVHGPLARVALAKGAGPERRVDRWLDVAFARGGPEASGELEAVFDPAHGRFREVRSRVSLSHEGAFEGGRGRAGFERTVVAREE